MPKATITTTENDECRDDRESSSLSRAMLLVKFWRRQLHTRGLQGPETEERKVLKQRNQLQADKLMLGNTKKDPEK